MDSSTPFPLFSSLRVVGDMNGRPFISYLSPIMTTRPAAFSPFRKSKPPEIRPSIIEVAWPVTAGLGVKVLMRQCKNRSNRSTRTTVELSNLGPRATNFGT
ncbi:hypothetical protein AVEN_69897-1 [Araneus ventricosus]|uniref:Uncharacterized protein n=1 Tax=Araneus ventricosus TaxID=182803 RepID=A0A4Y2WFR5_ARAVE|nr:hypothetical protein AVEN_69897-1 [Araneus ventricosus]